MGCGPLLTKVVVPIFTCGLDAKVPLISYPSSVLQFRGIHGEGVGVWERLGSLSTQWRDRSSLKATELVDTDTHANLGFCDRISPGGCWVEGGLERLCGQSEAELVGTGSWIFFAHLGEMGEGLRKL